ncbi:ABC-type transporter Mla maintaining outer membrane lipid asymmetry, MlaB component, contains STAS domain [Singulisphaera sp. GP187]|uniref:STAS domain-containing protein n=1 Tax=Singulisphaera sp. GP187 TaxID=1882752 RepID=UPI00092952F9|nr:STAS domain-containing protein [Singulisphaera sp. GP187]SIO45292.1 ABC-type transporter Mla maintaining outer membrane lipid asymmetry, MlaB component, contains STAS domain [Singulisphaera sp. GP187]
MSLGDLGFQTVSLSGPATLYELAEIRESLLAAIAVGKDLRIDLETTGPWDLAGLQLIISATASGRRAGQAVRLVNVPRVCVEIAERSGLSNWLTGVTDTFL